MLWPNGETSQLYFDKKRKENAFILIYKGFYHIPRKKNAGCTTKEMDFLNHQKIISRCGRQVPR